MFYRCKHRSGRYYASNECKACAKARTLANKAKAIADPAEAERRKSWRREHKRKIRATPAHRTREGLALAKAARLEAAEVRRLQRIAKRNEPIAHVKRWRDAMAWRAKAKARQATPKGALDGRMKTAIKKALKRTKAGRQWERLVGYTVHDLMVHLERQFAKGMSWSNMGAWHIDHRVPRAAFNYTCAEDEAFKQCWALTNLQPLWARDNLSKGDRLTVLA
jgi:hypothetical protein